MGNKKFLSLLFTVVFILSAINGVSAIADFSTTNTNSAPNNPVIAPVEEPPENPIIGVGYFNNVTLDYFNFAVIENGVEIYFENSSADSTLLFTTLLNVSITGPINEIYFKIDPNATLTRISIDLYANETAYLENLITKFGNSSEISVKIDVDYVGDRINATGAQIVGVSVSVADWAPNVNYTLTGIGSKEEFVPEITNKGLDFKNVTYETEMGDLESFSYVYENDSLMIAFSNSTVNSTFVKIIVFVNATDFKGKNTFFATIDNDAYFTNMRMDLYNETSYIKNLFLFAYDHPMYTIIELLDQIYTENPAYMNNSIDEANATYVVISLIAENWTPGVTYNINMTAWFEPHEFFYEYRPNYLDVHWDMNQWDYNDTWEWTWTNWEFGPLPSYAFYYLNETEITDDRYIPFDTWVKAYIKVPKALFGKNETVGRIGLNFDWWMANISLYGSMDYNAWDNSFTHWSSVYNYSNVDPYSTPHEFLELDGANSHFAEDSNYYYVNFTFRILSQYAVKGLYHFNLEIVDNNWNWISFGYSAWYTESRLWREVAVGAPATEIFIGYNFWLLQFLSITREKILSIPKGEDFIIQVNVTDTDLDYVAITMDLPWSVKEKINVTDWHEEIVTHKGGWVYNKTTGEYYYDENVTIYTREWVFGPHEVENYIWFNRYITVNVTSVSYNYTTGDYDVYNYTSWVPIKAYYIYNFTTGNFEVKLGYNFDTYVYNSTTGEWEWTTITVFLPVTNDTYLPFILSNTTSQMYDDGSMLRIEFVGHFPDYLDANSYVINVEAIMTNGDRLYYGGKWEEYHDTIAIGSLVLVAYFEYNGKPWKRWMYPVDKETELTMKIIANGPTDELMDIDGIAVTFTTSTYDWNETMWKWSQLKTGFIYNFITGTIEYHTYNQTERNIYVYGPYWTWAEVNKTGYHWKYNESTATWEWVNETYTVWEYVNVTGWHWEWQYYNHSSGEWVHEYIPLFSPLNEVNVTYINVTGFDRIVIGYKMTVTINMTFTNTTPDADYWWDVYAMNYTFGEDYNKPYGEYTIMAWLNEIVYSYNNTYGNRIYAETPKERDYAEINGQKYPIKRFPYIVINNETLFIKRKIYRDPWDPSYVHYEILFWGEYDPVTGETPRYYELINGTKIYVKESRQALIYNITEGGIDYYTFMRMARWDQFNNTWYFIDLNGIRHDINYWYEFDSDDAIDSFEVKRGGAFTLVNETLWLNLSTTMEYDHITGTWYIILENGTRYDVYFDDVYLYEYYFILGSARYYIMWPRYYYVGTYNGTDYLVPEDYITSYYYTTVNGTDYEMPYDGAYATYWGDLERTVTDPEWPGKVPVINATLVNGSYFEIYNITTMNPYIINGTTIIYITIGKSIATIINGTEYWDLDTTGFHVFAGNLKGDYWDRKAYEPIVYFDLALNVTDNYWDDAKSKYYDNMAKAYYLPLINGSLIMWTNGTTTTYANGSVIEVIEQKYVTLYDVVINGTHYYAMNPYLETVYDPSTGNVSYYYITLKNGTDVIFYDYVKIESAEPMVAIYNSTEDALYYNGTLIMNVSMGFSDYYIGYYVKNWSLILLNPYFWKDFVIYTVEINGVNETLIPNFEFIQKTYRYWGYPKGWMLMNMEISTIKFTYDVVVGRPHYGLWGVQLFTVDPETGALDLDGDLSTKDDQYYVKHVYWAESKWHETVDSMDVFMLWEPNSTIPFNELQIHSWMGRGRFSWEYKWNETFYWYHASDFSLLNSSEMEDVYNTVWDNETNQARPGYWDIGWMARNMTWEDIIAEAQAKGWDWITDNNVTWTWFWFGISEGYYGSWLDEYGNVQSAWIDLRYEYAGMFIYNDSDGDGIMDVSLDNPSENEATHYFVPTSVGSIVFTSPGAAFGNSDPHGTMRLPFNASVTFGAEYIDINGTVVPFMGYSYWDWWGGVPTGDDFKDFDHRPTDVYIDSMMFLVHFKGNDTVIPLTENVSLTQASIKIDQRVGDWDVDYPGGRSVLENRSLSLNWYVFADTVMSWQVESNGTAVSNNQIMEAIAYEMKVRNYTFAEIRMGETYVWGKNTTAPRDIASQTVPLGTFQAAYVSESSDKTVSGWAFTSTMYFLSVGFPEWDGYYVYNDPETVVYPGQNTNVQDDIPPRIANIYVIPDSPQVGDDVKIRFEAWDYESGLKTITVMFRYEGSDWQTATVTQIGDRFFEADLGTFQAEVWVEVKIIATDYAGLTAEAYYSFGIGGAGPGPAGPGGGPTGGFEIPPILIIGGILGLVVIIIAFAMARRRRRRQLSKSFTIPAYNPQY